MTSQHKVWELKLASVLVLLKRTPSDVGPGQLTRLSPLLTDMYVCKATEDVYQN